MKSSVMLVAFVAALVGGVAGALLVGVIGNEPGPAPKTNAQSAGLPRDTALPASDLQATEDLQELRNRLGALEIRIQKAESERDQLKEANEALEKDLTELKAAPSASDETTSSRPDLQSKVDRAVDEALKAEREKKQADERAAGLKSVDTKMHAATDRALNDLEKRLSLTPAQRDRVSAVFDTMNERVIALTTEASDAKQGGEAFDWGSRWNELMAETETSIRDELGSAQLATFEEMLGERGVSGILWPEK